jgi:hypothetical protein
MPHRRCKPQKCDQTRDLLTQPRQQKILSCWFSVVFLCDGTSTFSVAPLAAPRLDNRGFRGGFRRFAGNVRIKIRSSRSSSVHPSKSLCSSLDPILPRRTSVGVGVLPKKNLGKPEYILRRKWNGKGRFDFLGSEPSFFLLAHPSHQQRNR